MAGYIQKPVSHSKQHGCIFFFQVCMHVEAPETQNNTPNPRKDFFYMATLTSMGAVHLQQRGRWAWKWQLHQSETSNDALRRVSRGPFILASITFIIFFVETLKGIRPSGKLNSFTFNLSWLFIILRLKHRRKWINSYVLVHQFAIVALLFSFLLSWVRVRVWKHLWYSRTGLLGLLWRPPAGMF